MADCSENICACYWCIYYIGLDRLSFYEICNFVIEEFCEADVIIIERIKQTIKIRFSVPFTYDFVLTKLENYRYQTLIDIDFEEELLAEISQSTTALCGGNNVKDGVVM